MATNHEFQQWWNQSRIRGNEWMSSQQALQTTQTTGTANSQQWIVQQSSGNGFEGSYIPTPAVSGMPMYKYRGDVIRCKNVNCDTDYHKHSYAACPSCGTRWDQTSGPVGPAPEIKAYDEAAQAAERRIHEIMYEVHKEKKMGFLSLLTKRKELEIEIKKLAEDIEHHKKNEAMRIAEAVQKQRLQSNEEISAAKIATTQTMEKLKAEHETALIRLKGDHDKQIAAQEVAHVRAIAALEAKYSSEHYAKLSQAMTELHQHGDKNSQFIQNLALEMVKKTPRMLPTHAEVHVTGDVADLDKS